VIGVGDVGVTPFRFRAAISEARKAGRIVRLTAGVDGFGVPSGSNPRFFHPSLLITKSSSDSLYTFNVGAGFGVGVDGAVGVIGCVETDGVFSADLFNPLKDDLRRGVVTDAGGGVVDDAVDTGGVDDVVKVGTNGADGAEGVVDGVDEVDGDRDVFDTDRLRDV
jgi:hypothetical protein